MMVIYKTTNLINNKIYVGKDRNNINSYLGSGVILQRAIQKYGRQNFKKEILEFCDTYDELNEREKFWIKKLNAQDRQVGYNIAGGSGHFGYHISENHKEYLQKLFGTKIYQYDFQGNFLKIFNSINHAQQESGTECISGAIRDDRRPFSGNYIWSSAPIENEQMKILLVELNERPFIDNKAKNVYQYDLNGNFIMKYETLSQAAQTTGININSIIFTCKGRRKTAGKYIWSYQELKTETLQTMLQRILNPKRTSKSVLQYDTNNNLIAEYPSIQEASKNSGANCGSICQCCKGLHKTTKGFIWRYKE